MEAEERKLPGECGQDYTGEELEETIRGLRRLPAGRDSWVRAYLALLEKEKLRRKGEL